MKFTNWDYRTPMLVDVGRQICTRVSARQPLALRRHAWWIRRFPRRALRESRAMILWDDWRTAAPPAYRATLFAASP